MLHLLFIAFSLSVAAAQRCERGQDPLLITFDRYTVAPYDVFALPWPEEDFLFERGPPSGYSDKHIPVTNTSDMGYWANASSSRPNVIFTTGESLVVRQVPTKNNRAFVLLGLSMTSIYIDRMLITLTLSRNGAVVQATQISLPLQSRVSFVMASRVEADLLHIGCTNTSFDTCAHIAYDDFSLCYKHS